MSASHESIQDLVDGLCHLQATADPQRHGQDIASLRERLRQMGVPTHNLRRVRG